MTNLYLFDHASGNTDNNTNNIIVDHAFGNTGIDFSKVNVTEVDGIDMTDYPKFCDAYISEAEINGVEATEEQLEEINENGEFVLESVYDFIN
ncbi:MAG: hypothetical protein CMD92_01285 [Gammaproteobacteria bacterium]|nr:hypothetical protein [Gammaproteobacteria bacterium]|tara:strand:- start:664 stop:942 length:279 start_codon:yes stop_codon:yes gene_type:complete